MKRLIVVLALAAGVAAPAASASDWLRYGGDAQVTNDVPAAVAPANLVAAAHAGALRVRWRSNLDGPIVASPVYVEGADPFAGTLYVATEGGSVYAIRASDGTVIWQRTFPTYTIEDDDCGTYGISSTGTADSARGVLYVAGADGMVHALDLTTGADAPGWPVKLPIDTTTAYVWGGLTLVGNELYVPIASYCDTPNPDTDLYADGGLIQLDAAHAQVTGRFEVSGPGKLGGIWGYGGASVDPATGDLWVATGNSEPLGAGETQGYAEAAVQLDPSLHVLAWNRPSGIPTEDLDTDFGSTPLLFQPAGCPPLAAAHNKNGNLYVWRRDNLDAGPIWTMQTGPNDLATPFIGEPSWSADLQTLIVANARIYDANAPEDVSHYDATVGFKIGAGCTFPTAASWIADVGQGTKPPALIVDDVAFVAGGQSSAFSVLDASDGALLRTFFLENQLVSGPAPAGDEIVVGNAAGTLFAIGPSAAAPSPPAAAAMTTLRHLHRPQVLIGD